MVTTDPIADMLTRIRNGLTARHEIVKIPASNMKKAIAEILVEEGYIKSATIEKDPSNVQDTIVVELKYGLNYSKVISGLKRISRPGLRIYAKSNEIPKVLNGLGIAIISTSKGVMTDRKARSMGAGGEVLAYIW
ncbi:30S ribosomal protein S8 [bacterium]|nr:30S ribosomal protein S8 [bacterium]